MNNNKIIEIKDLYYKIEPYRYSNTNLREGYAYVLEYNGEYIALPYNGECKSIRDADDIGSPGIYRIRKSILDTYIIYPSSRQIKMYLSDNMKPFDNNYIFDMIDVDGTLQEMDVARINSETGSLFTPVIDNTDDKFKRGIKLSILKKEVDLKNYAHRFRSQSDMNNCKRGLIKNDSMSLDKFENWCNILDLDWEIIIRDKKNAPRPMGDIIVIQSEQD